MFSSYSVIIARGYVWYVLYLIKGTYVSYDRYVTTLVYHTSGLFLLPIDETVERYKNYELCNN
jgi:hypothetical protein